MGVVKQIDIKNRTYYFYNGIISKMLRQNCNKLTKKHTKAMVFTTLDILQFKKLMIVKIFTV